MRGGCHRYKGQSNKYKNKNFLINKGKKRKQNKN